MINPSHSVACGVTGGHRIAKHSLINLKDTGYLRVNPRQRFNKETKRRGMYLPAGLLVNLDKIPARPEQKRSMPGADAIKLADMCMKWRTDRKTFPKGFRQTLEFAAQRLIDHCDGDFDLALDIFNFACDNPKFMKAADHSLGRLVDRYKKVRAAFDEDRAAEKAVAADLVAG
jgi:hypothetical protein